MQKTEKKLSMVSGSPAKSLIAFTIPLILGNLFQQFYNLIDSVVVGNYVGEGALAAVGGTCFSITAVFIAVATGAGVGCSVIISQLLGADRIADMKTAVLTALKSVFFAQPDSGCCRGGFFTSNSDASENSIGHLF